MAKRSRLVRNKNGEEYWKRNGADGPPLTFREWRHRRKLTCFEIAVASGISIHTVIQYDMGYIKQPGWRNMQKLKKVYPDCPLATRPCLAGLKTITVDITSDPSGTLDIPDLTRPSTP